MGQVVVTDYPDIELVENLQYNVDHCDLLNKSTTSVQVRKILTKYCFDLELI